MAQLLLLTATLAAARKDRGAAAVPVPGTTIRDVSFSWAQPRYAGLWPMGCTPGFL